MRKTMSMFSLLVVGLLFGSASAFAVTPTIDGTFSAPEWANIQPYPYYLNVADPNEAAIPDAYDIERIVLLQNLTPADGPKGVYLAIQTYASPLLDDVAIGPPPSSVSLVADFNGDNALNGPVGPFPADIQLTVFKGGDGLDVVQACFGPVTCSPNGVGNTTLWASGANTGVIAGFDYARGTNALEFFFPTGSLGTPADTPFPSTFIGTAIYDNGGDEPDDRVTGTAFIPEPSSMMLLGAGLLGLIGYRRFRG